VALVLALLSGPVTPLFSDQAGLPLYIEWVEAMKRSERGPFTKVMWFCKDGSIQPPVAFACREHGGGHQHGVWSQQTEILRSSGYKVANLLAGVDTSAFLAQPDFRDSFAQLLIEKYLVGVDDGWIWRRALYYRGAIQDQDERAGARALLQEMASYAYWIQDGYPLLRTGAKILAHSADNASIDTIRQSSASLSDKDPAFQALRAKIHGSPEASDADRVRGYAENRAPVSMKADYLQLATAIDQVYQAAPLEDVLRERSAAYNLAPWLQAILNRFADDFSDNPSPLSRFEDTAELSAVLRDVLPRINSPMVRVQIIGLGLRAEREHFKAATELRSQLPSMSRAELLSLLGFAAQSAYGAGLINRRLSGELERIGHPGGEMSLNAFKRNLDYLARTPGWGMQTLRMFFQDSVNKLAELEPSAQLFIQDQLRASPLPFYSDVLDLLMRDANRQLDVRHRLFGEEIGYGLLALNPGLARGTLHSGVLPESTDDFSARGVYLLPETIAELPPIAGILTAGEGNPLSHIQLLARNLGIPNVVVSDSLLQRVGDMDQRAVVLAVSQAGLVELELDSERWNAYFPAAGGRAQHIIEPDLDKLDLGFVHPISLLELRAIDSGRIVGPKAAKLGELRSHYPAAVARGVALPFGLFYQHVLKQRYRGDPTGTTTVFDWMTANYRALDQLEDGSIERLSRTEEFRAELYDVVISTPLNAGLRQVLSAALADVFGPEETPGLFIRSDTNVEDLPGFTGAGLNLTLPNVVGFEALLAGIPRVWASPFTARAFAWRQSLMSQPEHVYTSILLLESVPVDKSGVLVTEEIETGDPNFISIAVNEGPGGAVDGQAAESLRVPLDGSRPRVLATATAPWRRVLQSGGGVQTLASTGSDTVLQPEEITQLIEFSLHLPETFPPIVDADGQPAPADVEFGFLDGQLRLFQIRPFLDSADARASEYLQQMDDRLIADDQQVIDLDQVPQP